METTAAAQIGCSGADSVWYELLKGLPTALVALLVGSIAAAIAYRQYRVARAKLNLDLFERRYAVFEATWSYLSSPIRPGESAFSTQLSNLIPQAAFLFGREMEAYLRLIVSNLVELRTIELKTSARQNIMAPEDIDRHTALTNWFLEEATKGARIRFGAFLDFEEWR